MPCRYQTCAFRPDIATLREQNCSRGTFCCKILLYILQKRDRAKRRKRELRGPAAIFQNQAPGMDEGRQWPLHYVWNQVLTVIVFFAAGFFGLFAFALARLRS
jgi:hypothetical protein